LEHAGKMKKKKVLLCKKVKTQNDSLGE